MPPFDPRKVPHQRRARETVRAIVDATAHILADGHVLTTNRVAEVAGVSIGSLYQYFPSKEALIAALVERMLDDDLAWADQQLTDGPLRPQLRGFVAALCERQAAQAALMAALLPLLPLVERDALARRAFAAMAGRLRERLATEDDLRPELTEPGRLDRAVFVATRAVRWTLNEAAVDHPEWLRDPSFHEEMARLVDGFWP